MHELGILMQILKKVENIRIQNNIDQIRFITLEVGKSSSVVPYYLNKLFPLAIDPYCAFKDARLHIEVIEGNGLYIKEIGY